jgi:glutamine---fructose-6-phosphate transaminase (isomerizing)
MCGIVGHIGPRDSVELVLEGLQRLEYRGYDSAGICFRNQQEKLVLYKKSGKLENLKNFISGLSFNALSCVGHTRWATHGKVNDTNAHPHINEIFAIVHNGIIENYLELKEEFEGKGIRFQTETDSEVFLHLITYEFLTHTSPEQKLEERVQLAISRSFKRIRGNSAFVIQHAEASALWAIKRGAPLVVGSLRENREALVSSDPYALVGLVDQLYFPQDEVLCILNDQLSDVVEFRELSGELSLRYLAKNQDMKLETVSKGQFEHFMAKEIFDQSGLVRMFKHYYIDGEGRERLDKLLQLKPSKMHFVACGTAWHAGLVMKNFFEQNNKIFGQCDLASEFRYRNPLLSSEDLAVFISQSGETADTLAAGDLCREHNVKTLAIVNVEGSTLYRDCDYNLLIKAGVEIGVASTKAFTLQVLTGYLLSMALAGRLEEAGKKMDALAEKIDFLLAEEDHIKSIAEQIQNYKGFIFTGRGDLFPIALEGALKLKEIAYVHAEGYAAGELKHGPIALIDETMVNIALVSDKLYEKAVSNIQEVKARRGFIVGVGPKNDRLLEQECDYYIPVNIEGLDELTPLCMNVALQLLAYYLARAKGTDIDKPRNLAKSVTVE